MSNSSRTQETVLSMFIVDAFTSEPFKGNGAAVCLLPTDQEISSVTMQKIAVEMNLSETAFISILNDGDSFQSGGQFGLRWFTPKCEVSLCGHATLASAAVLFEIYNNESEVLEFKTVSGILKSKKAAKNKIQIDLPTYKSSPVSDEYADVVKAVVKLLPVSDVVISDSKKLLIRLDDSLSRQDLEQITIIDAELLSAAPDIAGIIVCLQGSDKNGCRDEEGNVYDFISRYFAPWMGVSEDPVTGSAHSASGPYWARILGKDQLYARQCSKRGGDLHLKLHDNRILISGNAVITVRGKISF